MSSSDEGRKVDGRRKSEFEASEDKADRVPSGGVEWPAPGGWEPAIVQWYEAQRQSGQSRLLEQSDVATLYLWAEILNDHFRVEGTFKGSLLATWQQACRDMLVTEGSRRRARVEIDRGDGDEVESNEPAPATVYSLYSKLKTG